MRKRVFEYDGIYFKNKNDSANRATVIGLEMEFMFVPSSFKVRDLSRELYPITKNNKPSLIQLRKSMRELKLDQIEWFIHSAVEDGQLDELVFHPVSRDLLYDMEEELSMMLLEIELMGYVERSPEREVGTHINLEIYDMNVTSFYKFCKTFITIKDLIFKVSQRRHISTSRSDMEYHIGNRWGLFSVTDKERKYESFMKILLDGFKNKVETNLLGIRIYPDGRPLLELMWNNSTFNVSELYTQVDLALALKEFSMNSFDVSKLKFVEFVCDHKFDYKYLYEFILSNEEQFSLTRLLSNENRIF